MSLPEIQSSSDAVLDVDDNNISLVVPGKYRLAVELPYPVDPSKGQAKFLKSICKLHINLPTQPPPSIGADQPCASERDLGEQCDTFKGIAVEQDSNSTRKEHCSTDQDGHLVDEGINVQGKSCKNLNSTEVISPFSMSQDRLKEGTSSCLEENDSSRGENHDISNENQPLSGAKAAVPTENQKKWADMHRDTSTMHEIPWQPEHQAGSEIGGENRTKRLVDGECTEEFDEKAGHGVKPGDVCKTQLKPTATPQTGMSRLWTPEGLPPLEIKK